MRYPVKEAEQPPHLEKKKTYSGEVRVEYIHRLMSFLETTATSLFLNRKNRERIWRNHMKKL